MRCSICENENGGTVVCPRCGFDSRTDFIRLRTICPIPVQDKMGRLAAVQGYTQREYERRMYEEQRRNHAQFAAQNGYAAAYAYKQSDDAYAENKVYHNAGAPIPEAAPRHEAGNDNGERPFANGRAYDPERAQREREAWERDMRQRAEAERQRLAAEEAEKKRQQEQILQSQKSPKDAMSEQKKNNRNAVAIIILVIVCAVMSVYSFVEGDVFSGAILAGFVGLFLVNILKPAPDNKNDSQSSESDDSKNNKK